MGNSGNSEIGGLVNSGNWEIRAIGKFGRVGNSGNWGFGKVGGHFRGREKKTTKGRGKKEEYKKKDEKGNGGAVADARC